MAGPSAKHTGFWRDHANGRIYLYYQGTALTYWNASGQTVASGMTQDLSAGSVTLAAGEIGAADLGSNLKLGCIQVPLGSFREIISNDIPNTATAAGGFLAKNTTPILERVNGATDKALRINWASSNSDEITASFAYPPDLDDTAPVTVALNLAKDTNTDTTATVAVNYFEGIGDSNAGTSTAALSASTLAVKTVQIAASDIAAAPSFASISLIPSAHTSDAILLYGVELRYTRKT